MKTKDFGKYNFIGKNKLFAGISILMIISSIAFLVSKGLKYGIDFAGGTEVQVLFQEPVTMQELRANLESLSDASLQVQAFGEANEYLIRFQNDESKAVDTQNQENQQKVEKLRNLLAEAYGASTYEIRRVDSVGPQVGNELKKNGILAILYSMILILIYIGFRFDYEYAPSAVICLFHDSLITLGIFALIQHEVNVQILAAVLTIIGYSLNDTIINFDRIRENRLKLPSENLSSVVNLSINQVFSRSIITSVTTLLAVGALYLFAGGVIKDFAFVLGIGIIIGTYSSIYIAAPLVLFTNKFKKA